MKSLVILLSALSIIGCTSSVQVVDSIATPPISIDTTQPVATYSFPDSAKFVAEILRLYCRGETSGTQDGTDWSASLYTQVQHDTVWVAKPTIRLVIKRDTVRIPVPQPLMDELARLRENQEKHSWWYFVQFAAAFTLAGILLAFLAPFLGKLRGLIGA